MEPLHLLVHSANPDHAAQIEQALRAAAPDCRVEVLAAASLVAARLRQPTVDGTVVDLEPGSAGAQPSISPDLRHDLNNHLALIRMLADLLADNHAAPSAFTAKAREIASAAEAAAQALRRTKSPAG